MASHPFFSKKSDRRIVTLLAFVAVFLAGMVAKDRLVGSGEKAAKQAEQPEAQAEKADERPQKGSAAAADAPSGRRAAALHAFDPNLVDSATLAGFGIAPWKVHNFVRYRAAGKRFSSADELLKTYGWEEADVAPLRPYVEIGEEFRRSQGGRSERSDRPSTAYAPRQQERDSVRAQWRSQKFQTLTKVDLNTADTTLLRRIPGIGRYFSAQIVRLRERLGGFCQAEQLLEIDNFPEETLEWFEADAAQVRKISLADGYETLRRHPYIGWQKAKAIANYVRLYGPVGSEEALRNTHIFSEEELQRLLPYLKF